MNKQLLAVEFRYQDKPDDIGSTCHEKTITIGIYDTIKEAVEEGNKVIKIISKYFEVRSDDKFEVHGLFGFPHRLVSNCCYTTKGISYFAKITELCFDELEETIKEVFNSAERYINYRKEEMK